jgi:uncharacterized protein YecE (DUF72 family)
VIYVGTCGYAYKDWVGPFYPERTSPQNMLPFYARTFPAVEIDATYYAVPPRRTFAAMHARTPEDFRFSVKAPGTVTHPPDASARVHDDASLLVEALEPLRESGKLACVLAQFPNGFAPSQANEAYVRRVVEAFAGVPVVVEFRRRAWQQPRTLALLREAGAGYCNVDMPAYDNLLRPSSDATSSVGYVRFHGRNAGTWWKGSNVTRYDYDYSEPELVPWSDRVAEVEEQTKTTLVFFNNHARGQAARNARVFTGLLERRYGDAAPRIVAVPHPSATAPFQERLFGGE